MGDKKGLHIGIILDGNRRYAKKHKMQPWKGHKLGAAKVKEMIRWCKELDIRELTLYSFSVENFNRPKREVNALFDIFLNHVNEILKDDRIFSEKISIRFIGRLEMFPANIQEAMAKVTDATKNHERYIVNFAMAYGGRAEIVDAVRKITRQVEEGKIKTRDITEDTITRNLYLQDCPDMIIRPGGEIRVSNFLIWQSYYSEWYFCDTLWPEFTKELLKKAIKEYHNRKRRFGR